MFVHRVYKLFPWIVFTFTTFSKASYFCYQLPNTNTNTNKWYATNIYYKYCTGTICIVYSVICYNINNILYYIYTSICTIIYEHAIQYNKTSIIIIINEMMMCLHLYILFVSHHQQLWFNCRFFFLWRYDTTILSRDTNTWIIKCDKDELICWTYCIQEYLYGYRESYIPHLLHILHAIYS